jgi:hypothetical protein
MVFYCIGNFKADFDVSMSKKITDVSSYISYECNGCPCI